MDETNEIKTLASWISESRKIVFFGGAGVSTESGIPDFRSVDGLYHQKWKWPPEEILSRDFFFSHTADFYEYYRAKLLVPGILPNDAHISLAKLEQSGKLASVVTQNIDGLHQAAGSKKVYELHGSVLRNTCISCGEKYSSEKISESDGIPYCDKCGGLIKPDVVLYGESLDQDVIEKAIRSIQSADLLIVGGTSLTVYPAAGLIGYYRGKRIVLINRDPTPYDNQVSLVLRGKIGQVLSEVCSTAL